ncbi:adult-specific rigid cuticular protein 11.9-like, partial [Limulus polyphemus]|uniref:Adult-specific rigid cuticular protein 11.9-like n=1 Tax=Limulus polyphemus TaxID=6850 RepID=A0ABM1BVF4_LIMPO
GKFLYKTGDAGDHSREEQISSDGTVKGKYSYIDPNGEVREVRYTAGVGGFKPEGDISVDKKTAAEAARIAEMAPKAPEVPVVPAPVRTVNPWALPAGSIWYNRPLLVNRPWLRWW